MQFDQYRDSVLCAPSLYPQSISCNSMLNILFCRPLYFQHEGHSRTIIGIQATRRRDGIQQYNLLILDPAHVSVCICTTQATMSCILL